MMLMPATFSMLMVSSGPGDRTRAPPKPSGTCMRDFGAFAHFSGLVPSEPLLLARLGQNDPFKIQASLDASGEARATTGEIFDMSSVAHERDDKPSSAGRAREGVAPAVSTWRSSHKGWGGSATGLVAEMPLMKEARSKGILEVPCPSSHDERVPGVKGASMWYQNLTDGDTARAASADVVPALGKVQSTWADLRYSTVRDCTSI